jgi:hypothetical protein
VQADIVSGQGCQPAHCPKINTLRGAVRVAFALDCYVRPSASNRRSRATDGSHHQVAHVLAGDAAGSGQEAHGFPITAVERKRDGKRNATAIARWEAEHGLGSAWGNETDRAPCSCSTRRADIVACSQVGCETASGSPCTRWPAMSGAQQTSATISATISAALRGRRRCRMHGGAPGCAHLPEAIASAVYRPCF